MCLWVLLLIRCSAFTFLSNVGHITHTCTQHSPLSVSPSNSSSSPFKRKLLLACIAVVGFSATNRHCTVVATFCANGLVASVVPFVERSSDTTVGSRGEPGDRPHRGPNNRTSKRDTTLLPKTLRQWVYGPLTYKVFSFTFLSDVGHITHTCTQHTWYGSLYQSIKRQVCQDVKVCFP